MRLKAFPAIRALRHETLFVYGTLRKNVTESKYELIARHAEYIADGFIHGKLFEIGHYPGAVVTESNDSRVYGEVHRIKNRHRVLQLVDDYEECSAADPQPHEYRRTRIDVRLLKGGSLNCWAYLYNLPIDNLQPIPSGDYASYLHEKLIRIQIRHNGP